MTEKDKAGRTLIRRVDQGLVGPTGFHCARLLGSPRFYVRPHPTSGGSWDDPRFAKNSVSTQLPSLFDVTGTLEAKTPTSRRRTSALLRVWRYLRNHTRARSLVDYSGELYNTWFLAYRDRLFLPLGYRAVSSSNCRGGVTPNVTHPPAYGHVRGGSRQKHDKSEDDLNPIHAGCASFDCLEE